MLGCQDFCGYYDWTFQFLRRSCGPDAADKLWGTAIVDAQSHYTKSGMKNGLRGLYETWIATGEDEKCDWTFTLDEDKNVLRWDMRQCPSKGHLIENDRYADEDYCDHCMGWIIPVLEKFGGEIVAHEHNHCGQCWSEMRIKGKPFESLTGRDGDITQDARWSTGFIDRWEQNTKLPLLKDVNASNDSVDVLRNWFIKNDDLCVLGRGPSAMDQWIKDQPMNAVIVTDPTYVTRDVFAGQPAGVLIGDNPHNLTPIAERFNTTPPEQRPLLMHAYLPGAPMQAFADYGLPRPVPILPLLVREQLYEHQPHASHPTTGVFALLLGAALKKHVTLAGIDLYRHPTGKMYVCEPATTKWPAHHSEACDRAHLKIAINHLGHRVNVHPLLTKLLAQAWPKHHESD